MILGCSLMLKFGFCLFDLPHFTHFWDNKLVLKFLYGPSHLESYVEVMPLPVCEMGPENVNVVN